MFDVWYSENDSSDGEEVYINEFLVWEDLRLQICPILAHKRTVRETEWGSRYYIVHNTELEAFFARVELCEYLADTCCSICSS